MDGGTGMTPLFIASKRVEHDGSRRVVMTGAFIGDDIRVQGPVGAAEAIAGGLAAGRLRRELAEAETRTGAVKRAGGVP
jgi:hypothetical protein